MAKYTVTYKCGHTAEVQLYGKESERQSKIKWYATIDCPECEAKHQKEIAENSGLPALTGSEKQIAWATKIRNKALEILDNAVASAPKQNQPIFIELRAKWVAKEITASYWIDNRFSVDTIAEVVKLLQKSTK